MKVAVGREKATKSSKIKKNAATAVARASTDNADEATSRSPRCCCCYSILNRSHLFSWSLPRNIVREKERHRNEASNRSEKRKRKKFDFFLSPGSNLDSYRKFKRCDGAKKNSKYHCVAFLARNKVAVKGKRLETIKKKRHCHRHRHCHSRSPACRRPTRH